MDFLNGLDWGTYFWLANHPVAWLQPVLLNLAVLGSPAVLALVLVAAVCLLLTLGRSRTALAAAAGLAFGAGLAVLLQGLTRRQRPEAALDWLNRPEAPPAYPGGSALLAAVVYLTLALLAAREIPRRAARGFVIGLGAFLTVVVGMSRLGLGREFVSDLLLAWVGGTAWALACRSVAGRRKPV